MDTNTSQLNEAQRTQLDGIVQKMIQNKETDSNIQFVVNDFKSKYGAAPKKEDGFFKSIAKDAVNTLLVKPAVKFGQALAAPIVYGFGNEENKQRYRDAISQDTEVPVFGKIEGQKAFGEGGGKQIVGEALKTGSYLAGGGSGTLATKVGLTGVKKIAAISAENALLGTAYQGGNNLVEGKKFTDNLGTTAAVSAAIPFAGAGAVGLKNKVLSKAAPAAETFINSLIKPLQKDFAYGKNPARGILNEGITANSLEDLGHKVVSQRGQVGKGIGEVGQKIEESGISLNLVPGLSPINEAINTAAKLGNNTLFNSLNNVKTALMHDLVSGVDEKGIPAIVKGDAKNLISASYNQAKDFLSDIAAHTRFTGNPSDDKLLNMATKKAYGIVRQIMNETGDKVSPEVGQRIRNLNERYADLLSAESAINHREIVLKRQNILNLAQRFSIPIAIGTALLSGNWKSAGIILAAEVALKASGSTAVKTRVAQFLSRLAPEERQGILNSTPVLKNFYERATGQTSPGEGAPKTQALQATEDFMKKPKAGLSVENIGEENVKKFIASKPTHGLLKDLETYINVARKQKEVPYKDFMADVVEQIEKTGVTLPKNQSGLVKFFEDILQKTDYIERK